MDKVYCNVISLIYQAQKKNKSTVSIVFNLNMCVRNNSYKVLQLLWEQGFIYGFTKNNTSFNIFLKYSSSSDRLFKNIKKREIFYSNKKKLQISFITNPNTFIIVSNKKQIFINRFSKLTCIVSGKVLFRF